MSEDKKKDNSAVDEAVAREAVKEAAVMRDRARDNRGSAKKRRIMILAALAIAAGLYFYFGGTTEDANTGVIFTKVEKGPLVINITEAGSVKASDQIIIKSEVEGRPSILYVVPEGTRVTKGQLLVELDTSDLIEKRVSQDITVQNNESAFISAKEELEIVTNQSQSDVELAELKLRFAKEDLEKYREGEYPNKLNDAQGSVTLAQEELERARDKYDWSQKLFDEDYLSETELRSDELSWKRSELSLKTAESNLDLLERYTYKRDIAQLESDVRQNEMALERTKRKANSDVVSAQARLRAREQEYNLQKERLDKYDEQIAKAKITAPEAGLVIYATSTQNRRWNQEPLAEGQQVYERQELIYLPVGDAFVAEVEVHESNLRKIYPGLPARIRVDALAGKVFNGVISQISPLPDAQRMWSNPDLKVYKTLINIDNGGDVLKSGMNCQAEIIVEQYSDAMYLPVQSVVRVDKKPTVWVKTESGTEMREVQIGLDNNQFVHMLGGVEPGQEVMLTPPLAGSVSDHVREILEAVEIPTKEEAAKAAERRTDSLRDGDSGTLTVNAGEGQPQAGNETPAGGATRRRPRGGSGAGVAGGSGAGGAVPQQ